MPIYPYKCNQCNEEFEVKASLSEKEEMSKNKFKCKECGSNNIQQVITASGVVKSSNNSGGCGRGCCGGSCH